MYVYLSILYRVIEAANNNLGLYTMPLQLRQQVQCGGCRVTPKLKLQHQFKRYLSKCQSLLTRGYRSVGLGPAIQKGPIPPQFVSSAYDCHAGRQLMTMPINLEVRDSRQESYQWQDSHPYNCVADIYSYTRVPSNVSAAFCLDVLPRQTHRHVLSKTFFFWLAGCARTRA